MMKILPCMSVGAMGKGVKEQQKTVASKKMICVGTTFKTGNDWSRDFSSLIFPEKLNYMEVQDQNAINTCGGWFTKGHIKVTGDEHGACLGGRK